MQQKKRTKTASKTRPQRSTKRPAHQELAANHPNLIWLLPLLLILSIISIIMTHNHPLFSSELSYPDTSDQNNMHMMHPPTSPIPSQTTQTSNNR